MTTNSTQSSQTCRVVVGPDAVLTLRADSPEVPIVALVDATSPIQAVLAQTAGADIVLPTTLLESGAHADVCGETPGLAFAMRAAGTIAHRRTEIARSSRRVGHDLAGALNVIGLAAEVGGTGATDPFDALRQIGMLAKDAGADAWRAGRADRSSRHPLMAVDVIQLLRGPAMEGHDVQVSAPSGESWVFADERQLTAAIAELIDNARRAGADRIRVEVEVDARTGMVDIVVSDDGPRFAGGCLDVLEASPVTSPHSERRDRGLATIAEFVADIGGSLDVIDADASSHPNRLPTGIRLSIPVVDGQAGELARCVAIVDHATAQANILEGVVRHAPLTESLDAIVAAIENQLPDTACSVLLSKHGRTLHHGAAAKLPAAYRQAIDGVTIGLGQGSCGTAAFTGQPVVASDVRTDQNWAAFRDLATTHGLRSCWSTPIVAEGGEVLGTFAVYKSEVWNPDRAAVRLVERFTHLAAVAIEHHRLFGADASNRAKSDFLALVSHELRTPLNAILGFAQVMQMVDLDSGQRADGLGQIVHAGEHLRDLIDDLLDLSRIEAGQLGVVAEEVDPAVVIGEVVDLLRPLATTRDIELIEDPPTAAVLPVQADRRGVRQVLINLVGNAIKYTPAGGSVRVDAVADVDGMVRIGVTDSGPGIPPDSVTQLFQPFHRLQRDGQTNPEGTGLGLALSARLMEEMDGNIGVESTPGIGSCFWVEFPRAPSSPCDGPARVVLS